MIEGFALRELAQTDEFKACLELQREIWGASFAELVPVPILRIAQRTGGIVAGAFSGDEQLIGFVFGITGIEAGVPVHWSDMLAVKEAFRNRGLGEALKLFQRERLLERGVQRVYWTFDPLESKNAHINFARLGVTAREYVRDMYGESASPLHRGIGTDRLIAIWEIGSQRATDRIAARTRPPSSAEIDAYPLVNAPVQSGRVLSCSDPDLTLTEARVRIAIPPEIQKVKDADPEIALQWRRATRAGFEHFLKAGYVAVDLVRQVDHSSYVLERAALIA